MIRVEVWSDVVCPFCIIGKRNFEKALASFDGRDQVQVIWRSFELDPGAEKSQSISIDEVLARKYGQSMDWARKMNENMTRQGAEVGFEFVFERVVPTNSFDAHRLLHLGRKLGKENELSEALFSAYFTQGKDIADRATLESLAARAGIDPAEARACLESDAFKKDVRREETEAQELGITGVPAFVFNRQALVPGALPPETFLEVLQKLAAESTPTER